MVIDMIKLSIIIPCYNVEDYLAKCIDSVIDNKLDDYEVILVNDGSKDSTLNICNEYKKKYPKLIKVIDKENGGLSDARNVGLENSKGEYVTFLDSDDYVDKKMYKTMLDKAYKEDFDMVCCGVKMIYSDHTLNVGMGFNNDLKSQEDIKKQMYDFYPAACNKIYKKSKLDLIRFRKGIAYEDVEFIYRLLPNLDSIGIVDGYSYNYIQREGSITYTYNEKIYDLVNNFDSVFKYYKDNNIYDEYKEELEYVYVRYLYATFIKRLAKTNNKVEFKKGVSLVLDRVKNRFPKYRNNKYLIGKKGIYLKYFNRLIAYIVFMLEKNKMN